MSISVTFNSTHRVLLASEFFLARRPVVNRQQDLVAHELLFHSAQAESDQALPDELPAAPSVIADVCQHGLARVIGDLHGILYIDHAALMSDLFQSLSADQIVFELPATDLPAFEERERLATLGAAGFRFALVAEGDTAVLRTLLPLVEGVRIDVSDKTGVALADLCRTVKAAGKMLLAERVDTPEQFAACHALGFDFFQGYYFAVPRIDPNRRLASSELAITELMAQIASDAESVEIEHSLKSDVSLGLKLLRMANAPAFGHRRIDSLRQALMVVGRNQLQRWLQLMLYTDAAAAGRPVLALLELAATRGRLIELLAQKLRPANRGIADSGFTVGIMSLMDALFSVPMDEILRQMPVGDEVIDALQTRGGYLGKLLSLAELTEWADKNDAPLQSLLQELKLSCHDLYGLQLAAYEWSDAIGRHARLGGQGS